jgi:hypothetical protein
VTLFYASTGDNSPVGDDEVGEVGGRVGGKGDGADEANKEY